MSPAFDPCIFLFVIVLIGIAKDFFNLDKRERKMSVTTFGFFILGSLIIFSIYTDVKFNKKIIKNLNQLDEYIKPAEMNIEAKEEGDNGTKIRSE